MTDHGLMCFFAGAFIGMLGTLTIIAESAVRAARKPKDKTPEEKSEGEDDES